MTEIVGAIGSTHVPAIGGAIAKGLGQDPYWKPFFDGFNYVHQWLAKQKPDIAVMFSNDHGLNFFLDKMPTFAVGAANEYRNEDEGWGIPVTQTLKGAPEISWHIIEQLVKDEFDITTCQEMLVDHALTIPLALMYPGQTIPLKVVPIGINTVQHPLPSAARAFKMGQSVGRALRTLPGNHRVVVIGTGGLSHQLDGERAGFINKEFDKLCMDKLSKEPEALLKYSTKELVELSGSQGVEILNWIAMRGALDGDVVECHRNYHIPISNTAAATMVFDNLPSNQRKVA